MESISATIFWQYRVELNILWRMLLQSHVYLNYNSSATSTEMSVRAILSGSDALYDINSSFGGPTPYQGRIGFLADYLQKDFGYAARRVFHDPFRLESPGEGKRIAPTLEEAIGDIAALLADCRDNSKNFCLGFTDYMSHMAYEDSRKGKAVAFTDRFRISYSLINQSISMVLALIEQSGFWDNTLMVFFGDHGDELWSHSLKAGRCHTLEPYASLTHAPLFVFDNGRDVCLDARLVSGVDLRETLLKSLIPDYEPSPGLPAFAAVPFSGMDVGKNTREYMYSQSLYALQRDLSDEQKSVTKSYSVADGTLRLMVDSGGGDLGDAGLELFYDRLDPTNSRNLLDFFTMDADGGTLHFAPPPNVQGQAFSILFTPGEVEHIKERYSGLRSRLYEYVRAKEGEAMKHLPSGDSPYCTMPEEAFHKIRARQRSGYSFD